MPAVVTSSSTLPAANSAKTGQHALDRAVAQGVGYERPLPGSARAAVAGEFLAASAPSAAASTKTNGVSGGKPWGEEGGWAKKSKEEVRFRRLPVANDASQASGLSQARPVSGGGSGPSTLAAQPTPVVKHFRPINPPAVAPYRPSQEDLVGKTTPVATPSVHVQNPSPSSARAAGSTSKVNSTVSSPGAARTKVKLSLAGARPSLPPSATNSSLLSQSTANLPQEKDKDKSVKRRRSDGELKDGAKSSKEASGENGGEKKKKKHRESHVEDGSGTKLRVKLKKTPSANDGPTKVSSNNVPLTVSSTSPLLGTTTGLQPSSKPSSISSGTSSKTLSAGTTGITTPTFNVFPKQTSSPLSRLANGSSSTSSATKKSKGKEVEKNPLQNPEDSDEIEELDSSLITHNPAFGPLKPVEEAFREVDAFLSKPRSEHLPSSSNKPSPSAPSSSATAATPSGTLTAPIFLSSTATSGVSGTSLSSSAGSGPALSEDEKARTAKRSSSMFVLPPAIEIEGSSDESILMMDAIVLSSSDDDMDVDSGTEERKRTQQAKMKKEMERLKEQQRTVHCFQGKVEMVVGTEEKRVGTLKIVSANQGEYEMKIDLPRDIISVPNASVEKALLDAEARTMECHDLRLSVYFLENPSWISFVKTINRTMLVRPPHAPKPTTANISTATAGPSQPTTVRSAANASPGRKKKSVQPNLFIPPAKRKSPPPTVKRRILATSLDSLHPPGRHTAQADVGASEQDVPTSGYETDSYKSLMAFDPTAPLESRKPRPPSRFADTWTADETDGDSTAYLAGLGPKPKKVVKKPKLPRTARAGPSMTREDLEANAKEIVAVGRNVRAQVSATEFTIEVLQCNIGTGKIPLSQGDLPKQCTIAITAEMAPTESYKKAVILKEDIFFPMIEFEPSGRKTMMFNPPLSFHLPQHIFRTLPSNWPFPNDRGYRKGNFIRLRIEFLSFVDRDRKPSQWILDEFGNYTNDEKDQVFQCPVAAIPLIKPTRDGDMQRQDLHGNRAQLSIGGMTLNPEPFFSFKFQNYWDAATAAAASAAPLPKPKRERHKTPKKGPQVHVQPATEVKKKGKGPLVLDEEEDEDDEEDSSNDNDALEGLQSATNGMHLDNSDDSRAVTPSSREVSPAFEDEENQGFGRIRQAFTIVFNPTAPTFHPPPRPSVPRDTQQIHKGTLAHDIAALDRGSVDLETIEREEAIFFFEGIHDGQKFVMALWNRWCSSYGRIHQLNSDAHIKGFISRYFNVLHQKRVRVFLVIHLQILAAFDLCTNDTFAMAMALYTRCVQQSLRQSGVLPPLPA